MSPIMAYLWHPAIIPEHTDKEPKLVAAMLAFLTFWVVGNRDLKFYPSYTRQVRGKNKYLSETLVCTNVCKFLQIGLKIRPFCVRVPIFSLGSIDQGRVSEISLVLVKQ